MQSGYQTRPKASKIEILKLRSKIESHISSLDEKIIGGSDNTSIRVWKQKINVLKAAHAHLSAKSTKKGYNLEITINNNPCYTYKWSLIYGWVDSSSSTTGDIVDAVRKIKPNKNELFERILELLREYIGTYSFEANHKDAVNKILADYDGIDGYKEKNFRTPICNPIFLLALITCNIHEKIIDPTGKMAAIFEAIETATGINVFSFYEENHSFYLTLKYQQYLVIKTMRECDSFTEFMLMYPDIIEPFATSHETSYRRYINLKFIANRVWIKSSSIGEDKLAEKKDIVSLILNYDAPMDRKHLARMFDHAVDYLAINNREYLVSLFTSAFEKDKELSWPYKIATYLFCKLHHINTKIFKEHMPYHRDMVKYICNYVRSTKNFFLDDNILILKMIDHIYEKYNHDYEHDIVNRNWNKRELHNELIDIYSINNKINNFREVDERISTYFDMNVEEVLLNVICKFDTVTAEYLLKTKNVNHKTPCISHYPNYTNDRFKLNQTDSIKITFIQAALLLAASESKKIDSMTVFKMLQLLITSDPYCVHYLDSMGNSIFYYFRKLKEKKSVFVNQDIIERIAYLLCNEYCRNLMLPFISVINNGYFSQELIPYELISYICRMQFSLLKNSCDRMTIKSLDLKKVISLDQDEAVELFEHQLEKGDYNAAVNVFCIANQIEDDSNKADHILSRLYQLIKKPVNAVFLLKVVDHLRKDYSCCQSDEVSFSFIRLLNISHFLNDWNSVKRSFKINCWAKLQSDNRLILHALNNPESPAVLLLLEDKKKKIREQLLVMTPLQAIILDVKSPYLEYNTHDIADALDILQKIMVQMFSYNKAYLIERDDSGNDIYFYLHTLKNSLDKKYHGQVDELVLLVDEKKKELLYVCTNANLLFFHPESPYSQLPKNFIENAVQYSTCII